MQCRSRSSHLVPDLTELDQPTSLAFPRHPGHQILSYFACGLGLVRTSSLTAYTCWHLSKISKEQGYRALPCPLSKNRAQLTPAILGFAAWWSEAGVNMERDGGQAGEGGHSWGPLAG